MPLDTLFSIATALAALGWLLLILLPRHRTAHLVASVGIPLTIAVLYLVLIVLYFPTAKGGFGSLSDVSALFSEPALLLAGWIHYLAFDLFIGSWETRDAQTHNVPHLLLIPCLILTCMLGPIGLLTYFALRTFRAGRVAIT
jgi:hypothetical protein